MPPYLKILNFAYGSLHAKKCENVHHAKISLYTAILFPPLRLISDPATGKPRGFGFCEYEDGETAMSAVRNLAGREVNGRPLRIDSATNAPGDGPRGPGGDTCTHTHTHARTHANTQTHTHTHTHVRTHIYTYTHTHTHTHTLTHTHEFTCRHITSLVH